MLQSALPSHITVLRPHKIPSLKEHRAKNQKRWKQMTPPKPEQGYKLCCSLSQQGSNKESPLLPFPLDCRLLVKQTTKHCCCTGCPSFSGKSWLSQWVNNLFQLQEEWPGVQQKLLTFLSTIVKLMHQDPHTLAAWFIHSAHVGVRAQGCGRGGGREEESKQNI